MEDFISVSEIEMMHAKGGFVDEKNMYEVTVPYGVIYPPYGVMPPYGVNPPY
jgi:hypothetical protein